MEPEQEHLSKLYSGSGIHSLPELNLFRRADLHPISIRIIDKIDTHLRVFEICLFEPNGELQISEARF